MILHLRKEEVGGRENVTYPFIAESRVDRGCVGALTAHRRGKIVYSSRNGVAGTRVRERERRGE